MAEKTEDHHRRADREPDPAAGDQRATLIGLGLNKMHRGGRLSDSPRCVA